jgi:hopanoid biosynthesis associated RND transporter like protein HpnN
MNPAQASAQEGPPVRRLLVALVSTVCHFPRTVLALALILCVLSLFAAATRLEYHTQRNDLISADKDYQQRWRKYLAEFGDDDDIVAVVRGHDRQPMERALDALAERVRQRPELFDRLFYKVDLRSLRNRALLFLSTEEISKIRDNLRGMGPLLDPLAALPALPQTMASLSNLLDGIPISWQCLTLASLLEEATRRVRLLEPGQPLSAGDDQFLTQLLSISRAAKDTLDDPTKYKNPWGSLMSRPPEQKDLLAEPQYFFSGDGTLAFLLVRPIKEAGSFTAALKSVSAMREIVAATRSEYPNIEFGLTGLPVLETDEMAAADHDTHLASWLAIGGVSLLFILVYRGICYPLLTVTTLLVGTAWAMGWLTLTVGHLNILSATFAVMLIGMGDYGVLWVMRYEQARRAGLDVRDALLHTTTHVAIGNLTAASTLALAFFAAIFADFKAVAELGWIAGCGVLLCALACFTVLPSVLMLFDRRSFEGRPARLTLFDPQSSILDPRSASWLPGLSRRPGLVLASGLTLTAILAVCACFVTYDHNLLHLQAADLDAVKWELTLIEHTAGASWHALSYTDTPQEALALKARYEQLPEVSRVVEVATLVPSNQENKIEMLREIQERLRHLPRRGQPIPHARPDSMALQAQLTELISRLNALCREGSPVLLNDLHKSLRALRTRLLGTPHEPDELALQQFEQRLAGDLAEDLHRLRAVATPAPICLDELPAALRERYVGANGKWLLRVFAKDCLWDFEPLEHFTRQIHSIDPEATGKPFSTVEGLKAMKNGLQRAGIYAFLVIVVVLLLDFRDLGRTLIAMTPLLMGVVLSLGILGLCDVPLNPANMIAFPLILGVGVDNGVHVLHDYLIRRAEGRSMISHAIGRGVLVKALTTMIGFGTLMISTERGLVGLGFILTLGVGCSMLASLVFLPAVLHLLGRREEAVPIEQASPEEQFVRVAA